MLTHLLSLISGLMNIFGRNYNVNSCPPNFGWILIVFSRKFSTCTLRILWSIPHKYLSNWDNNPYMLTTGPSPTHRCHAYLLSWRKPRPSWALVQISNPSVNFLCAFLQPPIRLCASKGSNSFGITKLLMELTLVITVSPRIPKPFSTMLLIYYYCIYTFLFISPPWKCTCVPALQNCSCLRCQ